MNVRRIHLPVSSHRHAGIRFGLHLRHRRYALRDQRARSTVQRQVPQGSALTRTLPRRGSISTRSNQRRVPPATVAARAKSKGHRPPHSQRTVLARLANALSLARTLECSSPQTIHESTEPSRKPSEFNIEIGQSAQRWLPRSSARHGRPRAPTTRPVPRTSHRPTRSRTKHVTQ